MIEENLKTTTENSSTAILGTTTEVNVLTNRACIDYKILDSKSRNALTTEANSECGSACCDQKGYKRQSKDWKGSGWYR